MSRPTVEQVVKGFKDKNMKPRQYRYLTKMNGQLCGCALTALYPDERFSSLTTLDAEIEVLGFAQNTYGSDYANGVIDGFDGCSPLCDTQDYRDGYELGEAVWDEVSEDE